MTQPAPDEEARAKADAEAQAEAAKVDAEKAKVKAKGRPKRGQVIYFTARDGHTGEEFTGIGVVTFAPADGHVSVRPLAEFDLQVDPAGVEPVVVDEA